MNKDVEHLNNYLERDFGYFEATHPLYRIVWSEDQYEKRIVQHTDWGIELLQPAVVEKPKYKQWVQNKYILEMCTPVPMVADIIGKHSYEPIWIFQDKDGNPLPPNYDVCKIVIAAQHAGMAKATGAKYMDPRYRPDFEEADRARLDKLKEELFGNETDITDALAARTAVGYTGEGDV